MDFHIQMMSKMDNIIDAQERQLFDLFSSYIDKFSSTVVWEVHKTFTLP